MDHVTGHQTGSENSRAVICAVLPIATSLRHLFHGCHSDTNADSVCVNLIGQDGSHKSCVNYTTLRYTLKITKIKHTKLKLYKQSNERKCQKTKQKVRHRVKLRFFTHHTL